MANIFGFEFQTPEERKKSSEEYMLRIFPQGETQKAYIIKSLKQNLPDYDQQSLFLYYILIKDSMFAERTPKDFMSAVADVGRKQTPVKVNQELLDMLEGILKEDIERSGL